MATYARAVQASGDDGWDGDGAWTDDTVYLWIGQWDTNIEAAAALIDTVAIPDTASVSAATVSVDVRADSPMGAGANDLVLRVYLEAADDPAAVASSTEFGNRVRTTNYGTITIEAEATGAHTTDDMSDAFQEIFDRTGWNSGQNINILIDPFTTTNNEDCALIPYDSDTAECPRFSVTYTEGQQETTSGTINGGGGLTASVTQYENQIARPSSTISAGDWDTGPTTGQSLHGYTSDSSDTTYIEDTTA